MIRSCSICTALLATGLQLCPSAPNRDNLSRAQIESILATAVEYVLSLNPPGKYNHPVIISARIGDDMMRSLSIDSVGLTTSVSTITGVPIWDGEKYCDKTGRVHHWRMTNADYRVSPILTSVAGDTATVHVALAGSSSMSGISGRTLQLVRLDREWTPIGFLEGGMHASSVPCSDANQ